MEERKGAGGGLTWLALVIAIIALILGWTAFNRSGSDAVNIDDDNMEEVMEDDTMADEDVLGASVDANADVDTTIETDTDAMSEDSMTE